ncbi:mobile element protein [Microcystis sp. 0824]|nr:mobile element protein [Microcystis sp. 0824]
MMGVDCKSLLKMFNEWALEEYEQRDDINWLVIDGKSLKNTLKNPNNKQQDFIMFVSFFSQESCLVLHIKKSKTKKI